MGNGLKILAGVVSLAGLGLLGYSYYQDYKTSKTNSNNSNKLQPDLLQSQQPQQTKQPFSPIPGVKECINIINRGINSGQTATNQNQTPQCNSANVQNKDFAQKFTEGVDKFKMISTGILGIVSLIGLVIQGVSSVSNYIKGKSNNIQIPNNNSYNCFNNNSYNSYGFGNINSNNGYYKNQYQASQQVFLENNKKKGVFEPDENGVVHTAPDNQYAFVRIQPQIYKFVPKSTIPGYVD